MHPVIQRAFGGLAGGLAALGARLVPGFELVAGAVGLADRLARSDLVVTGEGRLDATSWSGKVVDGVVRAATRAAVPVLVVVGELGPGGIEGLGRVLGVLGAPAVGGGAPGEVQVCSLTERFGPARPLADPVGAVEDLVAERLAERPAPARRAPEGGGGPART